MTYTVLVNGVFAGTIFASGLVRTKEFEDFVLGHPCVFLFLDGEVRSITYLAGNRLNIIN